MPDEMHALYSTTVTMHAAGTAPTRTCDTVFESAIKLCSRMGPLTFRCTAISPRFRPASVQRLHRQRQSHLLCSCVSSKRGSFPQLVLFAEDWETS